MFGTRYFPQTNNGGYGGNDWDLDVNVNAATTSLRLRRTSGSTAGNANVSVIAFSNAVVGFTASTATSTVSSPPTSYYLNNYALLCNGLTSSGGITASSYFSSPTYYGGYFNGSSIDISPSGYDDGFFHVEAGFLFLGDYNSDESGTHLVLNDSSGSIALNAANVAFNSGTGSIHYVQNGSNSYFGIANSAGTIYAIRPDGGSAISGVVGLVAWFNGWGILGIGSDSNPLFGINTPSQTSGAHGIGGNNFNVQGNKVVTSFNNTLDDGSGNVNISGVLNIGLTSNGSGKLNLVAATAASGGLYFGTDTNLYRSASGTLKTDGTLVVATGALFGANSSNPTTTPMNVSFGGTYGTNTPGSSANLKWTMYNDGTSANFYGIGMSAALMEIRAGSAASIAFFPNNGVEAGRFNSNSRLLLGTTSDDGSNRLQVSGSVSVSSSLNIAVTSGSGVLNLGSATTASGGIYFGTDTNLYRSASGTLKTDGALVVAKRAVFGTTSQSGGGATTIDVTNCNNINFTATSNTTLTLSNGVDQQTIRVRFIQGGSASYTLTITSANFGTTVSDLSACTQSTVGKYAYVALVYISSSSKWDVLSSAGGFS